MAVMRLGYIHVRTTNLDAAKQHYCNTLGMAEVASDATTAHFKAWDEFDHHSVVLEDGGVGLVKLGYKCETSDDIADFEKRLTGFGCSVDRMSKGENLAVGDGIRVTLPSDHVVELYTEMEYAGTTTGTLNPGPYPRDVPGAAVHRLDHALITCEDPALLERCFSECLDFRPSERLVTDLDSQGLLAAFMFCGNTPHDIAFLKGENGKLHHFAFWLEDWNEILRAGDVFGRDDVPIDVGPTRHGITRGTTIYFFDPSGNRNEVFSGGYQTSADFPTITWTADQIGQAIFYMDREVAESFTSVVT